MFRSNGRAGFFLSIAMCQMLELSLVEKGSLKHQTDNKHKHSLYIAVGWTEIKKTRSLLSRSAWSKKHLSSCYASAQFNPLFSHGEFSKDMFSSFLAYNSWLKIECLWTYILCGQNLDITTIVTILPRLYVYHIKLKIIWLSSQSINTTGGSWECRVIKVKISLNYKNKSASVSKINVQSHITRTIATHYCEWFTASYSRVTRTLGTRYSLVTGTLATCCLRETRTLASRVMLLAVGTVYSSCFWSSSKHRL